MSECLDLVSFAEAFRAPLATCEAGQTGLVDAMQLSAHLSTLVLPPGRPATPPAPPMHPCFGLISESAKSAGATSSTSCS
jgi:hypothetical protein